MQIGVQFALGLGSSIASAVSYANAKDKINAKNSLIQAQGVEDEMRFNKQYYQDITKRTEIQNMLRILDENQRQADSRAEAAAAITGATPEQQLASREINRKTYADAVAQIASNASNLRDQYLRDYQGQRNRYYAQRLGMQDQLAAINANAAAQWANAAGNAFLGGAQMMAAGEYGGAGNSGPKSVRIPKRYYEKQYNEWIAGSK